MTTHPFTTKAQRVLQAADQAASRLGHDYVGTAHLLLGLVSDNDFLASQILSSLGVTPEQVHAATLRTICPEHDTPRAG